MQGVIMWRILLWKRLCTTYELAAVWAAPYLYAILKVWKKVLSDVFGITLSAPFWPAGARDPLPLAVPDYWLSWPLSVTMI